jgi:single-strand DNA-binding protein
MKSNQYVSVKGRITAKPEVKKSEKGNEWAKVGLAVNYEKKDKKGKKKEEVTFYDLLLFGKQSEIFSKLKKGDYVKAEGDYLQEIYINKKGEPGINNSVLVNEITPVTFVS